MSDLRFLVFHDGKTLDDAANAIRDMGHDIVYVQDIENGLKLSGSGDFYVVLIDITMTEVDGIEILKKIAGSGQPECVIAITDKKKKEQAAREVGKEICTFLNKPVDMGELRKIVENISEVFSLRKEVSDKTRKVSYLEVVNEIARETLLTRDENTLLWKIAHLIHNRLLYYNVNIFIMDEAREHIILRAFAGGFGDDLVAGYSLKLGDGIAGWVALNSEPLLSGDVRKDPRRIQGFSFEKNVLSELGVPVIFNDRVLGVLHVESEELNAFSRDDVMVLKTVADQMALTFENWRLSGELFDAYELSSAVNDTLPVYIILVDSDVNVKYVNQTFCNASNTGKEEMRNRPVVEFFAEDLVEKLELTQQIKSVFETGEPVCHSNVHHISPNHPDKMFNITFVRVQAGKHPRVMVLVQDVTEFSKKARQLSLIREITIAMQGVFERDRLLNMILTSVTAGFAMGFNRAFLFLVNNENNVLAGTMGVGPTSREEAHRIWNDLSNRSFTFEDYLEEINSGEIVRSGLHDHVEGMVFDLKEHNNILTDTVISRQYHHILDAWENPGVDNKMKKIIATNEFVTIPLIARNEVIGVLFADNAYSGKQITDESIKELAVFAAAAALAIENSHMLTVLENQVKELGDAYNKLENTHDMLIRHEKLAAIGEVSTRLAHEIRNPLATIGGFAKSIPRKYDDRKRTIRNANIIIEEVQRLENILTNVLDFTKTGTPKKTLIDINELVRETIKIMEGTAFENNVLIEVDLPDGELETEIDPLQIKQVLFNLIQNAFNAMQGGGVLEIKTSRYDEWFRIEIKDTGGGIPEELLDNIFDPFFTTRHDGTGLGLSISQRIIHNHNGKLDIKSIENEGTTIVVLLPVIT